MVCVFIGVALIVWVIVTCFRKFSDWRISKNNKKYFDLNKEVCEKNKKKGKTILESYVQYRDFIEDFNFNRIIRCSNSVVSNSSQNLTKYLLKYSNIDNSAEDMERLEFISKFLTDHMLFTEEMDKASNKIKKKLPLFYKIFADKRKLPYLVCGLNYELANIKEPFLCFLYISPGGRSRNENKIVIDIDTVNALVHEISKSISKKGHSKHQRSIMTNDLREAIKKRDNYTCCKCGNSVYDEPNLLLEVDHIIPVSKGGKTEASNLQTLCWRCNRLKSDKSN
jgi:hypothetical protein